MDLSVFVQWLLCAITVLGLIQWLKGLCPTWPTWVWGVASVLLCVGWAYAPEAIRIAAGALSITQLGYETLMQPFKKWLAGKSTTLSDGAAQRGTE